MVVVREPDEADVVITLRSSYKQKSPLIRDVEARGIPIYVLKPFKPERYKSSKIIKSRGG